MHLYQISLTWYLILMTIYEALDQQELRPAVGNFRQHSIVGTKQKLPRNEASKGRDLS